MARKSPASHCRLPRPDVSNLHARGWSRGDSPSGQAGDPLLSDAPVAAQTSPTWDQGTGGWRPGSDPREVQKCCEKGVSRRGPVIPKRAKARGGERRAQIAGASSAGICAVNGSRTRRFRLRTRVDVKMGPLVPLTQLLCERDFFYLSNLKWLKS